MTIFDQIDQFDTKSHPWRYIIIHHSATADGKVNDSAAIKLWHTGKSGSDNSEKPNFNPYTIKPMRDIGYHALIERINDRLEYVAGRSLAWDGGHTIGMNTKAIGICLVGNFDKIAPTHDQYFFLASLCRAYQRKFGIRTDDICPHSDFAQKTCPGKLFSMRTLRGYVDGVMTS